MIWLIGYFVGVFLMLVAGGTTLSEATSERVWGVIVAAVLWPIFLPMMIGAVLRGISQ